MLGRLGLNAFRGVSLNARLGLLKPKPKFMDITLRIEKLSGKCLIEKDNDLVLRNLVRIFYFLFAQYETVSAPSVTLTDITGASYSGYLGASGTGNPLTPKNALAWSLLGDVGVDTSGIVIGIGTTPPARTDYNMQSKIAHGTGVGQIYYNRQTYESLTDYSFRLNREFTNAGSDLSVAEAGLIYPTRIADTTRTILLLRDTFTPVSVTTGNGIRVRYTFSF
jgi:hypothetical protein